jgi:hypothetical protein
LLTVGVGDAEGVGVGELVGVEVGVGVATGLGFGAATFTPLFHTSFLPLLMQVYFLPAMVEVAPSLLHTEPDFTAAVAFSGKRKTAAVNNAARTFLIQKG